MTNNIKTIIIIGTLVRSCIRQLAQVSQSSVSRLGLSCCWCCQLGALVREKNSPKKHCGWFSGGWAETSLFAHLFGNHRPSFQNRQRQQPAIRCRQGRQVRFSGSWADWVTDWVPSSSHCFQSTRSILASSKSYERTYLRLAWPHFWSRVLIHGRRYIEASMTYYTAKT